MLHSSGERARGGQEGGGAMNTGVMQMGTTGLVAWCKEGSNHLRRAKAVQWLLVRRHGQRQAERIREALDKMGVIVEPWAEELRPWRKKLLDAAIINAQVKQSREIAERWAVELRQAFIERKPCPIKAIPGVAGIPSQSECILSWAMDIAQMDQ